MKKNLFLFIFCSLVGTSFAQLEEKTQIRATLLPLGVDTETRLNDQWSINLDVALAPTLGAQFVSNTNGDNSSDFYFELYPIVQTSARYYYNFDRREEKGKKISGNSGNYVGLAIQGLFSGLIEDEDLEAINFAYSIGPVWGIQRTYNSNIYLDLSLGLGYVDADYENDGVSIDSNFGGVGSFAIGYAFGQN